MRNVRLMTVSQHALCGGVSQHALGRVCVSQHALGRGSAYPSMHWAGGVCPGRGVSVQDGVSALGGCGRHPPPCEQNNNNHNKEFILTKNTCCLFQRVKRLTYTRIGYYLKAWPVPRETGAKTLPCRNFVAGGKNEKLGRGEDRYASLLPP